GRSTVALGRGQEKDGPAIGSFFAAPGGAEQSSSTSEEEENCNVLASLNSTAELAGHAISDDPEDDDEDRSHCFATVRT
ncbi:unnamed protein product, partial [Amoebophrya sp. A25]